MNRVDIDTIHQFSRAYNFNNSVSVQTRAYGIYFVRRGGIEAIRHIINPSISFSYKPDMSDPKYGLTKKVQIDSLGNTANLSPYAGAVYGGVPAVGKSGAVGFALSNTLEMKIRNKKDSTGKEPFKKINLLDNLNASTSYNLAADSFHLSPVGLSARTTLFGKLNVNMSSVLDPYTYQSEVKTSTGEVIEVARRLDSYAWQNGQGLGRITSYNMALSTSLNPKANAKKVLKKKNASMQELREVDFINANPDMYVDFNIPWNVNLSYNFGYTRTGFTKAKTFQSLTFSGDINLTAKWKIGVTSGYDFVNKTLVYPNINLYRDLHCWEMRLNFVPTGDRQSYSIEINVKASVLQDMKLSRRRSWYDR